MTMAKKKKKKDELSITELVEINAGYSRKLNLAHYGGQQYETVDIPVYLKTQVALDDVGSATAMLQDMAVHLAEKQAEAIIKSLEADEELDDDEAEDDDEEAVPVSDDDEEEDAEEEDDEEEKPKKPKKKAEIDKEELEEISEIVNDLTMAKKKSKLKKLYRSYNQEELSDDQSAFLKSHYKNCLKSLKDKE